MKRATKPVLLAILVTAAAGIGVRAFYGTRPSDQAAIATAPVTRGRIVDSVAATGTLQAVTTVQVGTQVSGTIAWLGADFNSIVRKGQIIAKLDPSLFATQVEQAQANLAKAAADLDNVRVKLLDAQQKYTRAKELADRGLLARSDLDAAKAELDTAEAQMRSTQAQGVQAQAAVNQAKLNLSNTVITAPIDGIVISRSVDVGQTVAASLQSPTIFSIAADLADMQLSASIDESDIGRIRPKQHVTFQVDAYPNEQFSGTVAQVRLQPTVVQNVTTYNVIIDVQNPDLKLKPGMTANVSIEVASRDDVVRLPNAAIRFRPTAETLKSLGDAAPDIEAERPTAAAPSRPASASENGATTSEALDGVVAERAKGTDGAPRAATIDALFGPLDIPETDGRVWVYQNGRLVPVRVTLGLSDIQNTELVAGDLSPDTLLVTGITEPGATTARSAAPAANNLFMPGPPGFGGARPGNQGGAR